MSVCYKVISGGQTGVDRAALDAATEAGLECGGWCPKGRKAEDGVIPARYPVRETAVEDYVTRTRLNVRDSDATLIIATPGPLNGGTLLTLNTCVREGKPVRVVSCDRLQAPVVATVQEWLVRNRVLVLNIAGPRESNCPGIYQQALEFLRAMFAVA